MEDNYLPFQFGSYDTKEFLEIELSGELIKFTIKKEESTLSHLIDKRALVFMIQRLFDYNIKLEFETNE